MKPSGIHHVAICVARRRRSDHVLHATCSGFTRLHRPDFGFGGHWLDAGGQQVHLMQMRRAPAPAVDHFAIRVDDLDAAVADIRATGVHGRSRSTTCRARVIRRSCTTPPATSSSSTSPTTAGRRYEALVMVACVQLGPGCAPVHDAVIAGRGRARSADDFDEVTDAAETEERARVLRAEVDASVGDVGSALAADRPRRGVHVLAAVGDVHVRVDELVVAIG